MNIFDYAMKMEQDGKAMYLELAEKTELAGVRNIFQMLADDEQKHYDTFRQMKDQPQLKMMADSKALENTKNIFEKLEKGRSEMAHLEGDLPTYLKGMEIEAESVKLYEDAAAKETNASVKRVLEQIAGEEKKHFNILENLYVFANAPNQYLEWREFSNTELFHQFGRNVDE